MATTWTQFIALVKEHLTVDANRRGIETYTLRVIKNAVIDLQRFIIPYRAGHGTVFTAYQLEDHGSAQLGDMPAGAKPKAIYFQSAMSGENHEIKRNRMEWFPWKQRQSLIAGDFRCAPGTYFYSISPLGKKFLVYPRVSPEFMTSILIIWEGLKLDFAGDDIVPWPEEAAEAVAFYLSAQINVKVDKNLQLAQTNQQLYNLKRLSLWRDEQERLKADDPDDEFSTDDDMDPILAQFNPQEIPLLRSVTTVEGVTVAALVQVPTTTFDLPFSVVVMTTDFFPLEAKTWTLKAGTDDHNPSEGVVRPADFHATTNPRVWYAS